MNQSKTSGLLLKPYLSKIQLLTINVAILVLLTPYLSGQVVPPVEPATVEPPAQVTEPGPPPGQVLFSSTPNEAASNAVPEKQADKAPAKPVTDAERSSVTVTSIDLDLHLAAVRFESHATLTIRNSSATPLDRLPLQLSSALRWQSVSAAYPTGVRAVPFTQSPIATDADHTGYAQEAVLTLPAPLAPDASLTLTVFYSGDLRQSGARLELLGTPADRASLADWDRVSADTVALRGFGNVLWYPVAAPIALLGDANRLFEVIGEQRFGQSKSTFRLRLTVVYQGEAPNAAILNGQVQQLQKRDDTQDTLVADTHGIATADFASRPLGFRSPSLFVTFQPAIVTDGQLLSVVTPLSESIEPLAAAAALAQPLLSEWLGPTPLTPLTVLDHPGQPFEDDALLVTPLDPNAKADDVAPQEVHGLTHAWLRSSHPWINEGLPQFMNLLWVEHKIGRDAVVAQLGHQSALLALAEPDLTPVPSGTESSSRVDATREAGQSLISARSEIFFRTKAAAVFWQLRDIVGEVTLKQALKAYRHSEALSPTFDADPKAFQVTLERIAKRDLSWFFDDWVYRDRSLPDLTIVSVSPRPLPTRPGKNDGYLVAVEVRNEGFAIAEVPVTVRSATFTATERLRIPAGASVSTRMVFEGSPEQVQVNDGTTPELRATIHTRQVQIKTVQP